MRIDCYREDFKDLKGVYRKTIFKGILIIRKRARILKEKECFKL